MTDNEKRFGQLAIVVTQEEINLQEISEFDTVWESLGVVVRVVAAARARSQVKTE